MFTFTITPSPVLSCADTGVRFLQSPFWALFKSQHGWSPLYFTVKAESNPAAFSFSCSILLRTFGKGALSFSIAYIPMVPELIEKDKESVEQLESYSCFLMDFAQALKAYLPKNILCVRYDPPLDFYTCEDRDFFVDSLKMLSVAEHRKFVKTKVDIQPPDTVLLDITQDSETLLGNMRSKWRYNIHLAEKKGVAVRAYKAGDSDIGKALDIFYDLYETTASRDGIAIHSKQYYADLFTLSADERRVNDAPLLTLYVASNEGDNLAAIITLFSKREAVYLYGASCNVKRNLMPAYLLQWTAIQDAKTYGSPVYDFYGMPPSDDKTHPMYGLYLFKTGFGGKIVHRPGSIDVPLSVLYRPYTQAEDIRAFYHKRIKKILAGRTK